MESNSSPPSAAALEACDRRRPEHSGSTANRHLDRVGAAIAARVRQWVAEWFVHEHAVSDRNERFHVSIENLIDPFVVLRPLRDETGWIVEFVYEYANNAAREINSFSSVELVGTRMLDRSEQLAPVGLFVEYATAIDTGQPLALNDVTDRWAAEADQRFFDVRAHRKRGTLIVTWRDVTDDPRQAGRQAGGRA
jgi:PAS domain-containing protein